MVILVCHKSGSWVSSSIKVLMIKQGVGSTRDVNLKGTHLVGLGKLNLSAKDAQGQ